MILKGIILLLTDAIHVKSLIGQESGLIIQYGWIIMAVKTLFIRVINIGGEAHLITIPSLTKITIKIIIVDIEIDILTSH